MSIEGKVVLTCPLCGVKDPDKQSVSFYTQLGIISDLYVMNCGHCESKTGVIKLK